MAGLLYIHFKCPWSIWTRWFGLSLPASFGYRENWGGSQPISADQTSLRAHDRPASVSDHVLEDVLELSPSGTPNFDPQDSSGSASPTSSMFQSNINTQMKDFETTMSARAHTYAQSTLQLKCPRIADVCLLKVVHCFPLVPCLDITFW